MIYARFPLSALRKEREVLFFTNLVIRNEIRADNELAAALLMAFLIVRRRRIFAIWGAKCHRKARSEKQLHPSYSPINYDEEDA